MAKTARDIILSMLFPRKPVCLLCGDGISSGGGPLCQRCIDSISPIDPPLCRKCGKPQENSFDECHDCTEKAHYFLEARAYGYYAGVLKELIYEFKYRGNQEISKLLGDMLLKTLNTLSWPTFDYIVPVPLHPKRERERGFNQALLLSKAISFGIGIPLHRGLKRIVNTEHQTLLDKSRRGKNLQGAFEIREGRGLMGKTILLVDDVYTTGATVDECAKSLKGIGVQRVFVLTVARG